MLMDGMIVVDLIDMNEHRPIERDSKKWVVSLKLLHP
jgi:hypothetical protein